MRIMKPHHVSGSRPTRRTIWIATGIAALLVVGAAIVASTLLLPRSGELGAIPPFPAATLGTPSVTPSATPGSPTTPPIDPKFGVPVAQTVPKDKVADFGDLVTAHITSLTEVTATGTLPGEVSGPAVQVDLKITNGTSATLSLDTITVNAYYGDQTTPASPYSQSTNEKFPNTLAKNASATARYLFKIPEGALHSVVITVSRVAGEPVILFQ